MRVSIIIFLLPLFGARGVPAMWKMGLSMILATVVFPTVPNVSRFPDLIEIIISLASEIILGLICRP